VYELGDPRIRLDLTAIAAADDDEVTGYATFLELADGRIGCLRALTVGSNGDDQGLGAALIGAQIGAAERAGVETLFAWARPWQHQGLYESLGYEKRTVSIDFQGPLQ
jgi:N-acetylglutamate synthase-like GNAT family acetyltransferase